MGLSKKSFAVSVAGLLLFGAASSTVAQEKNWSLTLGLKAWWNVWETWTDTSSGAGTSTVPTATSKGKLALIPSVSFKYKDFFVSGSYFAKTKYEFLTGPGATTAIQAERKEFDINIGWYFVPRLALTVGVKQVDQNFLGTTGSSDFKYTTPTIGITGSAPIADRFALYGSGVWGPAVSTTVNGVSQSGYSGSYGASEFGLAWLATRTFTMTAGYKYQIISNKASGSNLALRDITDGWSLGGLVTF